MRKTLVVCIYNGCCIANSYIINEEGETEKYINVDSENYKSFETPYDNIQEDAKKLLEGYLYKEEYEGVDKVLVVEDGNITYYDKLYW